MHDWVTAIPSEKKSECDLHVPIVALAPFKLLSNLEGSSSRRVSSDAKLNIATQKKSQAIDDVSGLITSSVKDLPLPVYLAADSEKPMVERAESSHEEVMNPEFSHEHNFITLDCLIKINQVIKGETKVLIDQKEDNEVVLIDPVPISLLIKKYIDKVFYEECSKELNAEEKFIKSFKKDSGFSVEFNSDDQIVEVSIPAIFIKIQTSSVCGETNEIDSDELIPPSLFSWYANFYLDKTINYLKNSDFSSKNDPAGFLCDYCFHKGMWTLEGDFDFGSDYYKEQLWSNIVLTKDIPKKNLRIGFGNIEPRLVGLQQGIGLMGISIDSNPLYFEDFLAACNNSMNFFLTRTSRVEILINGIPYKVIRLPPGPHQIQDFPCIQGSNLVTLKINNDVDSEEVLSSNYIYNPCTVREGLFAYSIGLGFPDSWKSNSYLWKIPAMTASCIYGVGPSLSTGSFFQISPRNLQLGTEQIWFKPCFRLKIGSGLFWTFQKYPNFQCYLVCDNSVCHDANSFRWNVNCHYFGRPLFYDFDRSGRCYNNHYNYNTNVSQIVTSFNVSRRWWDSYFISVGINASVNQKWKLEYGVSGSVSKNYNQYISASLSWYMNFNNPYKNLNGILLTITTSIANSSVYNNTSYISERNAVYNQTAWNKKFKENTNLSTSLGFEESPKQQAMNTDLFLNHNRFTASAMANTTKLKKDHHCKKDIYNGLANLSFGTCILYADGCYAMSRPNYNSFIILKPKSEISSHGIQVNNRTCSSWGLFPAVLDNQGSYDTICVDVMSENLPIGYNFGRSHFCCQTEYKSGTTVIVGEGKSYLASGKLVYEDNIPAKCVFGYVFNLLEESEEKIEFFTNREGSFQIEALKEGLYELHIIGRASVIPFEIMDNEQGFVELDTLVFPEKKEFGDSL